MTKVLWPAARLPSDLRQCSGWRRARSSASPRPASAASRATHSQRPTTEATLGVRRANYDKLGPDAVMRVGQEVCASDAIVGKVMNTHETLTGGRETRAIQRDQSLIPRHTGSVDRVVFTDTKDGKRMVRERIRQKRTPTVGDKFSSRHGQKGTVGCILDTADMPFTEDGLNRVCFCQFG